MFCTFGWLLQIPFAIFGGVISNRSLIAGWWFQRFFIFTPILGKMIQFHEYFSDGLKPPTRLSSGTLLLDLWIGSVQLLSSKLLGPEWCSLHISPQTLGQQRHRECMCFWTCIKMPTALPTVVRAFRTGWLRISRRPGDPLRGQRRREWTVE